MLEVKAFKVDYKKLNSKCAYCEQDSKIIRIATLTDGTLIVATLCEKDHLGEVEKFIEDGMTMVGQGVVAGVVTDSTLIDERVVNGCRMEILKKLTEAGN